MKKRAYVIIYSALSIMLGGIGIQKFYLGQTKRGVLHILFFWTFIPTIICLIDLLKFSFMSEEEFDKKYNHIYNNQLTNNNNITINKALKYYYSIKTINKKIKNDEVNEYVKKLNELYKNIIDISSNNNNNAFEIAIKELDNLLEYNIPTILKIINSYVDLENQKIENDNSKLKDDIKSSIIAMAENLKKILTNIYNNNAIDISSDIEVLKSTLK